jgi:hypothetical protein
MAAPFTDEPVAKKLQFGDNGSEFPNLGLWLYIQRPGHDANNKKFLADVDTRATLDDCFDHFLSLRTSSQRMKDQVVPRAQRLQSEVRRRWPDQINVRGFATITAAIHAHPQTHFHPPRWPRAAGHGAINVRHQDVEANLQSRANDAALLTRWLLGMDRTKLPFRSNFMVTDSDWGQEQILTDTP